MTNEVGQMPLVKKTPAGLDFNPDNTQLIHNRQDAA